MAAAAYHADPCEQPSLSSSIAHLLVTSSPRHAWTAHPKLNPAYEPIHDAKFDIGNVAHALLLEERDPEEAVVLVHADSWRTNAAKEQRDQAYEEGKTPLLAHQAEEVAAMMQATRGQLEQIEADPPLFKDGRAEQTLIWEEDGVTCRALLDWLRDDHAAIDDLKTTSASANPEKWTRTLYAIGSDVQAAFYLRGLRAVGQHPGWTDLSAFRFVVQETAPPYALSVVSLGPAALEIAESKVEYAISKWRECLERDEWPAYPTKVCYAELPAYEEQRWLEREEREKV